MVGTRRTNSCETCRKRRVKCDEVRPVCGQCAKKGRECTESPLPHLKWVTKGQLGTLSQAERNLEEAISALRLEPQPAPKELSLINSAVASNGATFHKYRICPGARPKHASSDPPVSTPQAPLYTPVDRLRHEFAFAYLRCPTGYRLTAFNSRIGEATLYLGQSPALDQAARCLLYAQKSLLAKETGLEIDSRIYHAALRSLQHSLNDPLRSVQSTTLCAISLLSCAEILGNRFPSWNYVNHARGLATLIEIGSLAAAEDSLGKSIIHSAVGSIIIDAFMKGVHCFLNKPEWRWLFDDWPLASPIQAAGGAVMLQFSAMADLLPDIRAACGVNCSIEDAQALVPRILAVKAGIRKAQHQLYSLLGYSLQSICTESDDLHSIAPRVSYTFADPATARVAVQCWAVAIQANGAIATLQAFLTERQINAFKESSVAAIRLESRRHAGDICRSIEYAKQYAPVESLYMSYPIYCAWAVVPDCRKDWLLNGLMDLNGCLKSDYNHAVMDYLSSNLLGCAIPAEFGS